MAETILWEVNKILAKAKTASFDVDLISPEPLDTLLLEDIGRITNTLIRLDQADKKVRRPITFEQPPSITNTSSRFM